MLPLKLHLSLLDPQQGAAGEFARTLSVLVAVFTAEEGSAQPLRPL